MNGSKNQLGDSLQHGNVVRAQTVAATGAETQQRHADIQRFEAARREKARRTDSERLLRLYLRMQ